MSFRATDRATAHGDIPPAVVSAERLRTRRLAPRRGRSRCTRGAAVYSRSRVGRFQREKRPDHHARRITQALAAVIALAPVVAVAQRPWRERHGCEDVIEAATDLALAPAPDRVEVRS